MTRKGTSILRANYRTPNVNRSNGDFKTGDLLLRYYENPQTVDSVMAGIESAIRCPQVVVVLDQGQQPLMIIRSEENASGGFFLYSLDFRGNHENWGPVETMNRDDFVKRAVEVMLEMKQGSSGEC
jgi:hypothetical protein